MKLHKNTEAFKETIEATSIQFKIPELFIEKDYWVTYALKNLSQSKHKNQIVFKGGTSLSKAHRIINRFSEDIDIAIIGADEFSGNAIKKMIKDVESDTAKGLVEVTMDGVTSKGSKFRKTLYDYPRIVPSDEFGQANERLLIEINSFANPHPYIEMPIQSVIADFYVQADDKNALDTYQLNSFTINVLGLERTFTEKILSLVRASYADNSLVELSDCMSSKYFELFTKECSC